ncbi:ABC transporter substrate-binding protein [Ciceribacter sp. L1K23]|uniref:ABC transporter substrate-binding protein n=1 Tax=unclassified Ciceribacter TaxID=2628820 RepID=UPI001ABE80F7|nr:MULTISPECIES: ABC transporter substrate-binding protein [unclassified Ciceribacter]MBO3761707.1 ABC transporter substrate-binding protein [Ciceribacter sp. L1K22]MBR0558387.1 ABC transporter substrate-binding protein [Ciceribacter sp. L1K23]
MSCLKRMSVTAVSALMLVGFLGGFVRAQESGQRFTIYMAAWRGCEEACQGFVDYIKESGMPADVVIRDAKTDKAALPTFVEEIKQMRPDLVITWGTNVTAELVGTYDAPDPSKYIGDIPSVFMVVADPVAAKIAKSYESSGRPYVSGTRNRVPEITQLKAMLEYRPFKRFGIIYNENELNSKLNADVVKRAADELGLELVMLPMPLTNGEPDPKDIPQLIQEAADRGVEFLYIGSSSFITVNADVYTEAAIEAGIPVASSYETSVTESSALLAVASKYAMIGRLAGYQAKRILVDKVKPIDLPIAALDRHSYIVNMKTAAALKLYPPMTLLSYAEIVNPPEGQ